MVEGMIRMMNTPDSVIGPVNIGNPGEFTILELAEKILQMTGSKSRILHLPLPQDDPVQRQPDIKKAGELLDGWYPKVQLTEGLNRTIEYFKRIL